MGSELPRARLVDVLRGDARVVGARYDRERPRGMISPAEAKVAMGLSYEDPGEVERRYLDARPSVARDAGVVARAALAGALSKGGPLRVEDRPRIVSAPVDNVSVEESIELVLEVPPMERARVIHFVHAHALNLASFDEELAHLFQRADVVFPDGVGIRLAARLLGLSLRANVNGTDLLPLLCDEAAKRSVPLVFVGAAPGVARAAADALERDRPDLDIPFVSDGYLDDAGIARVREEITGLGRAVVLVGMGSPRQERFVWDHLRSIGGITVMTVGGLFDFYSGRIPRAPVAVRELGLEWAFRMGQEPKRLAARYLVGNPLFLSLALGQRLFG